MPEKLFFPQNFLWGTSTSAYQIEGGIDNCDWSEKFPAGEACDHYQRYKQDFNLLQETNQNAYRLSIEWSRVEPEENEFNVEAINHYRDLLQDLKKRKIKVMVTLHHFTSPVWFSDKGGWLNSKSPFYFNRFAEKVAKEYDGLVDFWITINEPLIYTPNSYLRGIWPPFKKGLISFVKAIRNQIIAHKRAFKSLHDINKEIKVGIAKNNQFFRPYRDKNIFDKWSCFWADYLYNEYFLDRIEKELDFIGLNYYFSRLIKFPFKIRKGKSSTSDLGWEIYPEGIYHLLLQLEGYGVPIYITENGLADKDDTERESFIKEHLSWVNRAIEDGAGVKGYFHWSLIDNFEWALGFEPRFGLYKVNYDDFSREARSSASYYSEICKNNYLINKVKKTPL